MSNLFNNAEKLIDNLSAETVGQLATSLLQLESDSRIDDLREKLTDKLNETCILLCSDAKVLNTFDQSVIKRLYDQLQMVVLARNKLEKYSNNFIRKLSKNSNGKLVLQNELKEIFSKKINKIVDDLRRIGANDEDDHMVQEYIRYCNYLADLDVPEDSTASQELAQPQQQQIDSKRSLVIMAVKKKLEEFKIRGDFHAKLIDSVLKQGLTGLSEYSEEIPPAKLRQLGESLKQLDLNTEEKFDQKLAKDQIDKQIKAALIEMMIDEEDDLHARIIECVWRKGVVAALGEHEENIAPRRFRTLLDMLKPLQEKIGAGQLLEVLSRLKIYNEEGTLYDNIVEAVLKNGLDAINQFAEFITPKKFAQLVNDLKEKFPTMKSTEESSNLSALTWSLKIDFDYFNALDSSDTTHADFYAAVEKSLGQPKFVELIARRLIYLIKRQQDLKGFIDDLHKNVDGSEKMSLRQLLCAFLLSCSEDVRVKCYQLLSANNPVPLIIYQGGEFLAAESYWIGMADESIGGISDQSTTTRILSCGLEATCKGKTRLLNTLFFTSFEENEYSYNRFFNGTIDMQMVRNYGSPGNHLCIADAHGMISEVLLLKMAGAFDVIFVHLNESSCNLVKYIELIGKLASLVRKRIFVFVRESKIESREDCCNQERIKLTFKKLAALVGSAHGACIKLNRVPSLVKENTSKLYAQNLRVFVFDELTSIANTNEVNF